jgi:hypothetical protein
VWGHHPRRNCQQGCPQECFTEKTVCPKAQDQEKEKRKAATGSTFIPVVTRSVCVMKTAITACTLKDE